MTLAASTRQHDADESAGLQLSEEAVLLLMA